MPWVKTALHDFAGGKKDSEYPYGPLLIDKNGDVVGTSQDGGPEECRHRLFVHRRRRAARSRRCCATSSRGGNEQRRPGQRRDRVGERAATTARR